MYRSQVAFVQAQTPLLNSILALRTNTQQQQVPADNKDGNKGGLQFPFPFPYPTLGEGGRAHPLVATPLHPPPTPDPTHMQAWLGFSHPALFCPPAFEALSLSALRPLHYLH